jgi:DnaJ-class molecular chaperone
MPETQAATDRDARAKCETCNGVGFVQKMGAVMPGDDGQVVEVCPTCDGTGLKDPLSHPFPTAH